MLSSTPVPRRLIGLTASASIEVERKFSLPSPGALSERVLANGGTLVGEVRFTDSYWDTAGCALTRRDMWLRRRDEQWELKLPIEEDARRSGGERTVFREIETAGAVGAALEALLPGWVWNRDEPVGSESEEAARLEARLRDATLEPFAMFTTTRSKLRVGACAVDADIADFGHSVLELEVMCASAADVPVAEAEISRVAALLGAEALGQSGGKLETYIRRHCPEVEAQLIAARVLQPAAVVRIE